MPALGDPRGEWLALALAVSDEWEGAARLALARAAHRRTVAAQDIQEIADATNDLFLRARALDRSRDASSEQSIASIPGVVGVTLDKIRHRVDLAIARGTDEDRIRELLPMTLLVTFHVVDP